MKETPAAPKKNIPFSRSHKADEITPKGLSGCLTANAEECAFMARILDLPKLDSLHLDYQLRRVGRNRFRLQAHLLAEVTQSCVVTLDPVHNKIDEKFEIEFWTPEQVEQLEAEAEQDGKSVPLDGPEPLVDGSIDVGQLAYEHLAAALDAYPRKTDARFEWQDPRAGGMAKSGNRPFAVLARLKGPQDTRSK